MRVGIIVDWLNPVIREVIDLLKARGIEVGFLYPEKESFNLASLKVEYDVYLLKSGTDSALSLAGVLHSMGAKTLNPYLTVAAMRNKAIVTRMLQDGGVPVPETHVTTKVSNFAPLLENGPLILKPCRGSRGNGIKIIHQASDLSSIPTGEPILGQRYHKPDDRDLKVFRIGDQIFGSKRIWPLNSYNDKIGEPCTLPQEFIDITLRCGEIFGIDLYGLDIVISHNQPYVVDVNKFGSYMGVPDGPSILAGYIYRKTYEITEKTSPVIANILT